MQTTISEERTAVFARETGSIREVNDYERGGGEDGVDNSWDKVIRFIIYALTFLFPLLFTPFTVEPLEFSKQMLLFILGSAAIILWLLKLLVFRTWKFVKTPFDFPIAVFFVIYLLASFFSIDRTTSFLGFYGSFGVNFFQITFLLLFFYLVVNHFQTKKQLRTLFSVFFLSSVIAVLYAVLQFFGLHIMPFAQTKTTAFNTVGSLLGLAALSSLVVVLGIGYKGRSWFGLNGKAWRVIGLVAAFIILVTINFNYAWIGLLAGLLVYLVFKITLSGSDFAVKNIIAPLVILIVSVAFLVVNSIFPFLSPRNIFDFSLPVEVRLDFQTAKPVITGLLKEKPILGSGPSTFLYAFSQYRDQSFNLSPFWNVRFDRGPSQAAEFLTGSGILGFLAFEIFSLIFLIYGLYFLFRAKGSNLSNLAMMSYSGFVVLWIMHWFLPFNSTIMFAYWLFLAGFVAVTRVAGGERVSVTSFSLASSPRKTVGVVTSVSISLVLVVVFVFFAFSVYAADILYARGLSQAANTSTYNEAQANFERAIQLNRFRPDYYLTYGEFLFLRINHELIQEEPNTGQIQAWLADSINVSRQAVDLSPMNWTAWERLANLYAIARPMVAGVDRFIIESLQRATESDTKNPILFVELGQIYRLSASQIDPAILGDGPDTDGDGLSDQQEIRLGSDPNNPDSNNNGILDGNMVLAGLDPAGTGPLPGEFVSQYIRVDMESLLNAESAFRKAIELKSDYLTAHLLLSSTLEQLGKLDDGIEVLEQSLQRFPNDLNVKFELGRLYFNRSDFNLSARQFNEILQVVPNHANARFSLGSVFEAQGNLSRALIEFRRVAESNPDNEFLRARIADLESRIEQSSEEELP